MARKRREALERALFKLIGWPDNHLTYWPLELGAAYRLGLDYGRVMYYPQGSFIPVSLEGPEDLTTEVKLDLMVATVQAVLRE